MYFSALFHEFEFLNAAYSLILYICYFSPYPIECLDNNFKIHRM